MNDFTFGWTMSEDPKPFIETGVGNQVSAEGAAKLLFGCVATETYMKSADGEVKAIILPTTWSNENKQALTDMIDKLSALAFSACALEVNEVQEQAWFDKVLDEMAG